MDTFIFHLRKLIEINSRILTELDKDEPSTASLGKAFDERGKHTKKMGKLMPAIDKDMLSEKESANLKALFEKFNRQAQTIQDLLNNIVDHSRNKLNDAVKRRKAEDGYRALK